MRNFFIFAFLSSTLFFSNHSLVHAETVCKVTDPTGTPLNIRSKPNGKVINKLKNGRKVVITDNAYDNKGRPWVYLEGYYKGEYRYWGWAIREFISCYNR